MGQCSILRLGELEVEVCPECWLPQGSPLSLTLIVVFVDELFRILGRIRELNLHAFANDLSLYVSGDL